MATEPNQQDSSKTTGEFTTLKPDRRLYSLLWIWTIIAYLPFLGFAGWFWYTKLFAIGPIYFNLGFLFLLPVVLHIMLASLKPIDKNELGALYFYGRYIGKMSPGLHFVPAGGFVNKETQPRDLQTILEPGPRDKIFWGDEKEDLREGMVRPIFMNTAPPKAGETRELDVQMTLGLGYTVLWTIEDPATFMQNVHTIPEAMEQIRTMSETVLSEAIAQGTADDTITDQAKVNNLLKSNLEKETKGWGIKIRKAALTIINPSHPLAEAMRDRAKAEFERQTAVLQARAKAEATELQGKADGEAARARASGDLKGRAEGMKVMHESLGVEGSAVLAAETARATIPGANATILGKGGLQQIAALGSIFEAGLGASQKKGKK